MLQYIRWNQKTTISSWLDKKIKNTNENPKKSSYYEPNIYMKNYLATDSLLRSTPYSAPYSKIKQVSILLSFITTIIQAILLTDTLHHPSFISKREKTTLFIQEVYRNIHFLTHF